MAEYIEREVKKITCEDCVGDKFCPTYEKYDESLLKDISGECDVSKLCAYFTPAADVVEVVHAHWIDRDGKTWCSKCDASNKQYKPPYCPHCGAKMDGENYGKA